MSATQSQLKAFEKYIEARLLVSITEHDREYWSNELRMVRELIR